MNGDCGGGEDSAEPGERILWKGATWGTRTLGEVQWTRRRTSAESGSEMGRETRKAEARTAKGLRTGRRTVGVDSQVRLREVGGMMQRWRSQRRHNWNQR